MNTIQQEKPLFLKGFSPSLSSERLINLCSISLDKILLMLSRNRRLQTELSRPRDVTFKYYDSYYGIAFTMFYMNTNKKFEVFLNSVFGMGSPGLSPKTNDIKSFGATVLDSK